MFKLIVTFIFLFGIFFFGITAFRNLPGKEQWALTKSITYSIIVALLAVLAMAVIVVLF